MSLFRILSITNNTIIDDLGLLPIVNAVVIEYERDKIVPQINVILAARNISPVKDIPDLLQRFYKIDYYSVLNAIRVVNKPISCFVNKDYNTYLKNERLISNMIKNTIIEALKGFCFCRGMYALTEVKEKSKVIYKKAYVPDQVIRKIFLLRRGNSGNPDMEEETRIDRAHGRKTPPPMSKKMIEKVTICASMFETEIKKYGLGFDLLDDELKVDFWKYVEDPIKLKKNDPGRIIESYLHDSEIRVKIVNIALKKCFVETLEGLCQYLPISKKEKKNLIKRFDNYVDKLSTETKILLEKVDDISKVVVDFIQNCNQSV